MAVLLVVAVVLFSLPAFMYLSVRTGDLARVEVADDALVVRPRGLNRLWAMKAEVRIPLSQVSGVCDGVARRSVPSGFRLPGTSFPGVIQAGTFRTRGQRSFWLVGRAPTVTVVECPGGRFDRIVLQLTDKEAMKLRRAVGSGPS